MGTSIRLRTAMAVTALGVLLVACGETGSSGSATSPDPAAGSSAATQDADESGTVLNPTTGATVPPGEGAGSATTTDPTTGSSAATADADESITPAGEADLSVTEDDVEGEIERLMDGSGSKIEDVDCPGDLPGRVGATMRCTATIDGKAKTLAVVVTSTEDDTTKFDVEIDD